MSRTLTRPSATLSRKRAYALTYETDVASLKGSFARSVTKAVVNAEEVSEVDATVSEERADEITDYLVNTP